MSKMTDDEYADALGRAAYNAADEEDEPSAECEICGFRTWFLKSGEMQHEHGCPREFEEVNPDA